MSAARPAVPLTPADFSRILTLAKSDLPRAQTEAARLCQLHRQQPAVENLHGVILSQMGAYHEAADAFRRALGLESRFMDALNNLAATLSKLNCEHEALECFERLLAASEADPDVFYNYGNILLKLDRNEDAINAYRRALNLAPGFVAVHNNLGNALIKLGHPAQAAACYENVLKLDPAHHDATRNLATVYAMGGQFQAAAALYQRMLSRNPQDVDALLGLAKLLIRMGDRSAAIEGLERLLQVSPAAIIPQFLLDAQRGNLPVRAPLEYTQGLFDGYADRFEQELTGLLEYRTPTELLRLLAEAVPAPLHYSHTLDIGCGTGLAGAAFHSITARLSGIDLSSAMLAKARAKALYDSLLAGDAVELIRASDDLFDLVVCADTLPYIGDLVPLFTVVSEHIAVAGHFLCSAELADSGTYTLQPSVRFAHCPAYVIECAAAAGLDLLAQQVVPLRKERGVWLHGGIYCFVRRI